MTYVLTTVVCVAADQPVLQAASAQAGPLYAGMFGTRLSASGNLPATHYVSSGLIPDTYVATLSDPAALFATGYCGALTLSQVTALVGRCSFFTGASPTPLARIAGLGLIPINA